MKIWNLLSLTAVFLIPGPLFAANQVRVRLVCSSAYGAASPPLRIATGSDRYAIIDFIGHQREQMGLDPVFGADGRSVVSDLEFFEMNYIGEKGRVFLLEDGEHILGTSALTHLDDTTAEIKKVYVDGSLRGLGAGRQLIGANITEAHERGYHRIVLQTRPEMERAIGLYLGFGFKLNLARSTSTVLYYELNLAPSAKN